MTLHYVTISAACKLSTTLRTKIRRRDLASGLNPVYYEGVLRPAYNMAVTDEAELDHPEWQPIPLELPLENPYGRPSAPSGDPDPDADLPRGRVIVIDLA